jgi:hypothetical protein
MEERAEKKEGGREGRREERRAETEKSRDGDEGAFTHTHTRAYTHVLRCSLCGCGVSAASGLRKERREERP